MKDRRSPWLAVGVAAAVGAMLLRRRIRHRLFGKVVLITGGTRGLGLELARECLDRGARVAVLGRDGATAQRAEAMLGERALGLACDVTDEAAVGEAVGTVRRWLGEVDVVMHVAGQIQVGPHDTMTPDDFRRALDVHLFGALHVVNAVVPAMRERGEGSVVIVSSIGGLVPVPHLLPYTASKFALSGYAEGLRAELARDGVRVTTVYPGLMRTGSPRNADFKGDHRAEYAWFTVADSLPGLSMPVRRAARRIADACERGQARLVMVPMGRAAVALRDLAPGLTSSVLSGVNRLLPDAGEDHVGSHTGRDSESAVTRSPLTTLTRKAEASQNQE